MGIAELEKNLDFKQKSGVKPDFSLVRE